jgi:RNA polymerase sigma-70 factor (ECF subfamily)
MVRPSIVRSDAPQPESLDVSEIFKRHRGEIERWASRLGGPLVDSDDVVQDVFAVVQRRIADYRPGAALTTWLYKITQNIATTRRRRERLRRWLRGLPVDYADDIATQRPSAVDEMERREAAFEVYAALDRLDEKYRSAVILFEMEGLSGEQIATLTGRPLSTVWIHLHRGRQKFRLQYERLQERRNAP